MSSNPLRQISAPRGFFTEPPPVRKICRWCDLPLQDGRCRRRCRQPELRVIHRKGCKPIAIGSLGCDSKTLSRIKNMFTKIPNTFIWWILKLTAALAKNGWHRLDLIIWKHAANSSKLYRRVEDAMRQRVAKHEQVHHDELVRIMQPDIHSPLYDRRFNPALDKCKSENHRMLATAPAKIAVTVGLYASRHTD